MALTRKQDKDFFFEFNVHRFGYPDDQVKLNPPTRIKTRVKRTIKLYNGRYSKRLYIYLKPEEELFIKKHNLNIPHLIHLLLSTKKIIIEL